MNDKLYNVYRHAEGVQIKCNDEPINLDQATRLGQGINAEFHTNVDLISVGNENARRTWRELGTAEPDEVAVVQADITGSVVTLAANILASHGYQRYDLVKMALAGKGLTRNQAIWLINEAAKAKAASTTLAASIASLTS